MQNIYSGVYKVCFKATIKVNGHTFIQNIKRYLLSHSSVTQIHVYNCIMLISFQRLRSYFDIHDVSGLVVFPSSDD
jgi:hypothetical protein